MAVAPVRNASSHLTDTPSPSVDKDGDTGATADSQASTSPRPSSPVPPLNLSGVHRRPAATTPPTSPDDAPQQTPRTRRAEAYHVECSRSTPGFFQVFTLSADTLPQIKIQIREGGNKTFPDELIPVEIQDERHIPSKHDATPRVGTTTAFNAAKASNHFVVSYVAGFCEYVAEKSGQEVTVTFGSLTDIYSFVEEGRIAPAKILHCHDHDQTFKPDWVRSVKTHRISSFYGGLWAEKYQDEYNHDHALTTFHEGSYTLEVGRTTVSTKDDLKKFIHENFQWTPRRRGARSRENTPYATPHGAAFSSPQRRQRSPLSARGTARQVRRGLQFNESLEDRLARIEVLLGRLLNSATDTARRSRAQSDPVAFDEPLNSARSLQTNDSVGMFPREVEEVREQIDSVRDRLIAELATAKSERDAAREQNADLLANLSAAEGRLAESTKNRFEKLEAAVQGLRDPNPLRGRVEELKGALANAKAELATLRASQKTADAVATRVTEAVQAQLETQNTAIAEQARKLDEVIADRDKRATETALVLREAKVARAAREAAQQSTLRVKLEAAERELAALRDAAADRDKTPQTQLEVLRAREEVAKGASAEPCAPQAVAAEARAAEAEGARDVEAEVAVAERAGEAEERPAVADGARPMHLWNWRRAFVMLGGVFMFAVSAIAATFFLRRAPRPRRVL